MACYSSEACPEGEDEFLIGQYATSQGCCIIDEALTWQARGESCLACLCNVAKTNFPGAMSLLLQAYITIAAQHAYIIFAIVYGWKKTYYEARKGDTLTLTVGTIKGFLPGRVLFEVDFDANGKKIFLTAYVLEHGRACYALQNGCYI